MFSLGFWKQDSENPSMEKVEVKIEKLEIDLEVGLFSFSRKMKSFIYRCVFYPAKWQLQKSLWGLAVNKNDFRPKIKVCIRLP